LATFTPTLREGIAVRGSGLARHRARAYFTSDGARTAQTVLGLLWLLDGGLQFQSFMYSHGFIAMLLGLTPGQPPWVASSVSWGAHMASHNLTVFNTLFALVQVAIGLGLLYRPTVKPALAVSFAWALAVWWFGEAFGMMLMTMATPLTGAPGAVILYALAGAMVWPGRGPGGLLGVRGARLAWAALWLLMAWLWLEAPSSAPNAVHDALVAAPSGMSWLSSVQLWVAKLVRGDGLIVALVCAALSAGVGIGVAVGWRPRSWLLAAAVLQLALWVLAQGFGGIFAGGATDPNAAPLFLLLAYVLSTLIGYEGAGRRVDASTAPSHA
jgi:hypothetical protein